MDPYQQRARSPSAEHMNNLRQTSSQSPHNGFNTQANTLGVDPSLLAQPGTYPNTYDAQSHPSQPQFDNSAYITADLPQTYSQQPDISDQAFFQPPSNQFSPSSQSHFSSPGANTLDNQTSPFGDHANNAFDDQGFLDPALLDNQDFSQEGPDNSQFANMATIHQTPSDPPHLLQPQHQRSPHTSPGQQQSPFQGPHQHGRNLSLDPSSAAFPHGQHGDQWAGMSFRHQRSPSDQYSDVSSAASPYLQTSDSFDVGHSSPMINGQQDQSSLPDALGLNHFSLSDPQMQQQSFTPAHSPHISPNVSPHPGMQTFNSQDSFGMLDNSQFTESQFSNSMSQGYNQGQEEFPQVPGEQFSPPEIQVEFAPPAKQPSFNTNNDDGLHVPDRSGRGRRALSDPHTSNFSSRSQSPVARSRSPSQPLGLHPGGIPQRGTRSPSPGAGAIQKSSHRRSSTSAVPPNRDALLALADPARSAQFEAQTNQIKRSPSPGAPSPGSDTGNIPIGASTSTNNSRRVQKHPATFQCHLCPKRFTRAYNLRSHLRTHTDERPFVCTVCGKAFARQHDRKRHEGLHSGEKKFVCKGLLNQQAGAAGGTWGCGRRFARADALGRHFRSEAGRACIKPLLDEEARERQAAMMDQQTHEMMAAQQQQHNAAFAAQQQQMGLTGGPIDYSNIPLPAALLQQYPALAGIQWDAPGGSTGMQGGDEDDFGSRSSFDASSGGEFDDFGYEEDGGYVSGPGMGSEYPANGALGAQGFGGGGYLSDDGRGR